MRFTCIVFFTDHHWRPAWQPSCGARFYTFSFVHPHVLTHYSMQGLHNTTSSFHIFWGSNNCNVQTRMHSSRISYRTAAVAVSRAGGYLFRGSVPGPGEYLVLGGVPGLQGYMVRGQIVPGHWCAWSGTPTLWTGHMSVKIQPSQLRCGR